MGRREGIFEVRDPDRRWFAKYRAFHINVFSLKSIGGIIHLDEVRYIISYAWLAMAFATLEFRNGTSPEGETEVCVPG